MYSICYRKSNTFGGKCKNIVRFSEAAFAGSGGRMRKSPCRSGRDSLESSGYPNDPKGCRNRAVRTAFFQKKNPTDPPYTMSWGTLTRWAVPRDVKVCHT